jgi:hypothetical protein
VRRLTRVRPQGKSRPVSAIKHEDDDIQRKKIRCHRHLRGHPLWGPGGLRKLLVERSQRLRRTLREGKRSRSVERDQLPRAARLTRKGRSACSGRSHPLALDLEDPGLRP